MAINVFLKVKMQQKIRVTYVTMSLTANQLIRKRLEFVRFALIFDYLGIVFGSQMCCNFQFRIAFALGLLALDPWVITLQSTRLC